MVMKTNKLMKTPPTSRGNSPNRNNNNNKTSAINSTTPKSSPIKSKLNVTNSIRNSPNKSNNNNVTSPSLKRNNNSNSRSTPKRSKSPMKAIQNGINTIRKASPARTPPDFEFIINSNTKQRQLIKSSSNRSSRGTSPAKSECSSVTLLRSRGSE